MIANLQHGIMEEPAMVYILSLKNKSNTNTKYLLLNLACNSNCSGCTSQTVCTGCTAADSA